MNISIYQEAAVLCKMDYLVLCDGAAGNMCVPWKVKWVSGQQWKIGHCLNFSTSLCHIIWESETMQVLHASVYGMCESQHDRVRRAEGEQEVPWQCIGTNVTEDWNIKVGICFFPAQRSFS